MTADPLGSWCRVCGRASRTLSGRCCDRETEPVPDWYGILGCPRDASSRTVHTRFRELALRWHPDRATEPEARETFIRIADAYQILRDPDRRRAYDLLLAALERGDKDTTAEESLRLREENLHATSRRWAEHSLSALESSLTRIDSLFRGLADASQRLLRRRPWLSREHRTRGRLAAASYGLFGFWFVGAGAILFPLLVLRRLRRAPEQEETLLTALGVLQLLPVLGYLLVAERVPDAFHALFWTIATAGLITHILWRRRFRTTTRLPDRG